MLIDWAWKSSNIRICNHFSPNIQILFSVKNGITEKIIQNTEYYGCINLLE